MGQPGSDAPPCNPPPAQEDGLPAPVGAVNDAEQQLQGVAEVKMQEKAAFKALGFLDRFLAVWIFLAMVIGIILGNFVTETGPALERGKFVGVSVPIGKCLAELVISDSVPVAALRLQLADTRLLAHAAIGLLVMMYPIMCKIRFELLHHVLSERAIWKQIAFSLIANWLVAPFLMVSFLVTGLASLGGH